MKYFIVRANTNDDYYENRAAAFIVAIDAESKETINKLATIVNEAKKTLPVYQISIFSNLVTPIPRGVYEDLENNEFLELFEQLDTLDKEYHEINKDVYEAFLEDISNSNRESDVDTITMHVNGSEVKFEGYYKHTNIHVESGNIEITKL